MYQGSGDLVGEANVLNNLGIEAYFAGDWSAAVEYYSVSRDLRRQAGDVAGEALAANNLAEVLSLQGRYEEATELFGFAQRTWESAGYPLFVAFAMANLALVRARAGEPRAGLATLGSARFLSLELGASALRLEMDVRRIECLLLDRQFERALAEAVPLCDELDAHHEGDDELTTQLLPLLALAQWVTGDHVASEATLCRTVQQAEAESNHYVAASRLGARSRVGGDARCRSRPVPWSVPPTCSTGWGWSRCQRSSRWCSLSSLCGVGDVAIRATSLGRHGYPVPAARRFRAQDATVRRAPEMGIDPSKRYTATMTRRSATS